MLNDDHRPVSVLHVAFLVPLFSLAIQTGTISPAYGQSTPSELAEEALQGINPVDSISEGNLDVVEPYETTSPPEADLTNSTIETAIEERRVVDDAVESQAFNAMEESAANRPEFPGVADDPAMTARTEAITDAAPEVMADLFSSEGSGICEVDDFEGTPLIDAYCERSQSVEERRCNDELEVTLERHDRWRCIRIPEVYPQTCQQRANVTCNNPPNCLISALNYSVNVPQFHRNSYPVPRRSGGWWKNPTLPGGHGVTGHSYIAQEAQNRLTLSHMFFGKYPWSSVWGATYQPSTRRISFDPDPSGVVFTRFDVEIVYEEWGLGNLGYAPPDCRPRVLLNGSTTLMNGQIYPGFQHQTGSNYGPCRAFSDAVNDRSPNQQYRLTSRTFNLLPWFQAGIPVYLDITTQGQGLRGIKTIFHVNGSCCLNPSVSYENLSCQ